MVWASRLLGRPLPEAWRTAVVLPFVKYPVGDLGTVGFMLFAVFAIFSIVNGLLLRPTITREPCTKPLSSAAEICTCVLQVRPPSVER